MGIGIVEKEVIRMRRRATRGCKEEGRWFRNGEEGGQGVGADQNGVIAQ